MKYSFIKTIIILLIIDWTISKSTKTKIVGKSKKKVKESTSEIEISPYTLLANYYAKMKSFKGYNINNIEKALKHLSFGQNALKSMDGATHSLKNTISDSSSLKARYKKFISGSKRNTKEAAKIFEYVTTVERTMQAAEIIQCIENKIESKRRLLLSHINLVECERFTVGQGGLNLTISILLPNNVNNINTSLETNNFTKNELRKFYSTPKQYEKDQIIIAITDTHSNDKAIGSILKIMNESPQIINVNSVGFVDEEVTIQKSLMNLSHQILFKTSDFLLRKPLSIQINVTDTNEDSIQLPRYVRVVGYSAGGAVGSYLSMLLDGTLNTTQNDLIGKFKQRVKCVSIGPPPCVSRSVIPRYITSVICGDDIICRSSHESLNRLTTRLSEALSSGAGGSKLNWVVGGSWMKDIASVATQSLKQYAAGSHDLSSLSIAGRVFFIKSREHKQGASIQRVLRGNWKEDMLWVLHDILLSKRMIAHHSLDSYIKTLSRC